MNNRFRDYMICVVPTVICLLLQNACMIFFSQINLIRVFLKLKEAPGTDISAAFSESITSSGFLMGVSLCYAIIGILLFFHWYRGSVDDSKDSLKGYPFYLFFGILIFAIGSQFVSANIMAILAHARPDWLADYEELMKTVGLEDGGFDALTILYTAVFGPICEELCFRGLTQKFAMRVMRPYTAISIQAFLFGGMHANPMQSTYAFVFGWVIGFIYYKTNNLLISVLSHITFNSLALIFSGYIGTGTTPVSFYCILLVSLLASYFGYSLIEKAQGEKDA